MALPFICSKYGKNSSFEKIIKNNGKNVLTLRGFFAIITFALLRNTKKQPIVLHN
jgi:hypothetical protein